jgi:hypothetical protein
MNILQIQEQYHAKATDPEEVHGKFLNSLGWACAVACVTGMN